MDKYTKVSFLSLLITLFCISTLFLFFISQSDQQSSVLGIETEQQQQQPLETMYSSKDLSFIYDHDRFELKESEGRVLLFPQAHTYFQYAVVNKLQEGSWLEELSNSPLYSNLKEILRESYDEYDIVLFSFEQPSFLNPEESKEVYLTVYVREEGNKVQYIEVRNFNFQNDMPTNGAFVRTLTSMEDSQMEPQEGEEILGATGENNVSRILGAASTLRVFARNCYDVNFTSSRGMAPKSLLGKSYTICSATSGSGFVISPYGDVMTNAHVAKPHKFDSMINGVSTTGELETLMAEEMLKYLEFLLGDLIVFLSQEEVESFYVFLVYEMYKEGGFNMTEKSNELYVQSNQGFDVDIPNQDLANKDNQYSATLVRSNSINSFYQTVASVMESEEKHMEDLEEISESPKVEEGITDISDVAIFRFDNLRRFPSLKISSNNPTQGENVTVVGYPYLDADAMLVSKSSLQASTITGGSITNIKRNTKDTYDLVQIDASIEVGNSGGPILNSEGDVLGMTTYSAFSESGNYNLGVSSVELAAFVGQEHITNSRNMESDMLVSAVSDISKDYHSRAKGKLDELLQAEPALASSVDNLLETAERNIEQGNDKSPWIDLGFVDIPNWGLLIIGIGIIVLFLLLFFLIVKKIAKGKQGQFEPMFEASEPEPVQELHQPAQNPIPPPPPQETLRPQAFIQQPPMQQPSAQSPQV
jgi:S1-C subfamily serine protease